MHNRSLCVFFFCFFSIFGICSSQPHTDLPSPQAALDRAVRVDRVIIAGQPAEAEIRSLPQKGISHIVNVRTPEEMNDTN